MTMSQLLWALRAAPLMVVGFAIMMYFLATLFIPRGGKRLAGVREQRGAAALSLAATAVAVVQSFLGYFTVANGRHALIPFDERLTFAIGSSFVVLMLLGVQLAVVAMLWPGHRDSPTSSEGLLSSRLAPIAVLALVLFTMLVGDWRDVWLNPAQPFLSEVLGTEGESAVRYVLRERPVVLFCAVTPPAIYLVSALLGVIGFRSIDAKRLSRLLGLTVAVALVAASYTFFAYYDAHPLPSASLTLSLLQGFTILYVAATLALFGLILQLSRKN